MAWWGLHFCFFGKWGKSKKIKKNKTISIYSLHMYIYIYVFHIWEVGSRGGQIYIYIYTYSIDADNSNNHGIRERALVFCGCSCDASCDSRSFTSRLLLRGFCCAYIAPAVEPFGWGLVNLQLSPSPTVSPDLARVISLPSSSISSRKKLPGFNLFWFEIKF